MSPSSSGSRRITSLDVLRGIAIAGMVLVHVERFTNGNSAAFDQWRAGFEFFARGKFNTIFALLFGVGFGLEVLKGARGAAFLGRLASLAIIMGALKLIFGSSLLYYVIWGAPLVLLYRLPSEWLAATGIALIYVHSQIGTSIHMPDNTVVAFLQWADPDTRGPFVLATFIAGLLAVRLGVVTHPKTHRPLLIVVASVCIGLVIAGAQTLFLGVAYAAIIMLFAPTAPRVLALIGRASLTNFALHLLVLGVLFRPWGLGLSLDWRWTIPVALAVFGLLAAVTALWLRFHRQGPLEALVRSMSASIERLTPTVRPRPLDRRAHQTE